MQPYQRSRHLLPCILVLVTAFVPSAVVARSGALADFVLLVVFDGLRADTFERDDTPTLKVLRERGAWTTEARTTDLSLTLPAHATLLTGQGIEKTGVRWNHDAVGPRYRCRVPNVFTMLGRQGFSSAAFHNKTKLRLLMDPAVMQCHMYCGWDPRAAAARAVDFLRAQRPSFLFVHLAEPDSSGHRHGWMSEGYFAGLRRADDCLRQLMLALCETEATARTLVIVASDHGGTGTTHGGMTPEETQVPLLLAGNMVSPGTLPAGVSTACVVPTVLHALGASIPEGLDGRPLTEAFVSHGAAGSVP